jgi:hypothetical protein
MTMGKRVYLMLMALGLLALSVVGPVDRLSERYTDQALSNAAVTFAVARMMNGVISVIQGTRLSASPAGLGLNVAVGEILDPINDLLEQFSWIMLAATTSLGIQKILLAIGPSLAFNVALAGSILYLALALWRSGPYRRPQTAIKLVLMIVIIRFSLALVVLANQLIFDAFMQEDYQRSVTSLEQASEDMERLNQDVPGVSGPAAAVTSPGSEQAPTAAPSPAWKSADAQQGQEDEDWLSIIKRWYDDTVDVMSPTTRIEAIKQASVVMMNHIFKLIAIFVLQTILLPILFLWILYRTGCWLIKMDLRGVNAPITDAQRGIAA